MKKLYGFTLIIFIFFTNCGREEKEIPLKKDRKKITLSELLNEVENNKIGYIELNKIGAKFYKQKKYEKAAHYFKRAVLKSGVPEFAGESLEKGDLLSIYNLVSTLSILYNQKKSNNLNEIIRYSGYLLDLDFENKWIKKLKLSPDFNIMSNSIKFKQLFLRSDLRYSIIENVISFLVNNISKLDNINIMDSSGHSLLFYAIKEKNYKSVNILLNNSADINRCFAGLDSPHGLNSPLIYLFFATTHHIYQKDYYDMIKFLIDKGADINVSMNSEYNYEIFEDYYLELKGKSGKDHQSGGIGKGLSLLKISLSYSTDPRLVDILFANNISLKLHDRSDFLHIKKGKNDSKEVKQWRSYIINLLLKHKDKETAMKYIKYIETVD